MPQSYKDMPLPPWIRMGYDKLDNPVPLVPDVADYTAHEAVRTLGEIYDLCRTLPSEGNFLMVFFDKGTGKFLQSDESIFHIQMEHDQKRLCMYSGYHDEWRNIKNKDFLYSCDPNNIGKVHRVVNKPGMSWVINEDTTLYANTKRYGNHTINDVISFDWNGQSYIGFVSNVTVH